MSDPVKELVNQSLTQMIAALTIQGVAESNIAKELKVTRYAVRKVRASDEFKLAVKQIGETAAQNAVNAFKAKFEELEPLAYSALKQNLIEGKLEAVKVWGQFAGVNERDENEAKDTSLTVILPGAQPPPKEANVIDITDNKDG